MANGLLKSFLILSLGVESGLRTMPNLSTFEPGGLKFKRVAQDTLGQTLSHESSIKLQDGL
jgi:hypothetical protein